MKEIEHDKQWLEDHQRNAPEGAFDDGPVAEAIAEHGEAIDPMSPEYAPGLSLIVLMRIYDTQLALLRETSPEVAENLVNLHAQGRLLGPLPYVDAEQWN